MTMDDIQDRLDRMEDKLLARIDGIANKMDQSEGRYAELLAKQAADSQRITSLENDLNRSRAWTYSTATGLIVETVAILFQIFHH